MCIHTSTIIPTMRRIKRSIFLTMFLRAYRLCSPESLDEEIMKIFDIAMKLWYPKEFVELVLLAARKTYHRIEPRITPQIKNVLVLPYNEHLSVLLNALK